MKFKKLITFLFLLFITCSSVFAEIKFVKIVLVGDFQCGKTAIWKRLMDEGFDQSERQSDRLTPGELIKVDGDNILSLRIWDTAGLDKYYSEVVNFTTGANFVFIVHDLDKKLDDGVKAYLSKIYKDVSSKIVSDGKIVIVGSKFDLRKNDIVNSAAQAKMLEEVAQHIPCACVLTSAKNEGDPGINTFIKYIIENSRTMNLPNKNVSKEGSIKFNVDTQPKSTSSSSSNSSSSSSCRGCTIL